MRFALFGSFLNLFEIWGFVIWIFGPNTEMEN